jgi:hypothetical protein
VPQAGLALLRHLSYRGRSDRRLPRALTLVRIARARPGWVLADLMRVIAEDAA